MRKSFIVLAILVAGCVFGAPALAGTPPVIVQYHMWWDTRYGVESDAYPTTVRGNRHPGDHVWLCWDLRDYGAQSQKPSPDNVKSDGWRRYATTSRDYYPLIGLYDPDDPEVLRWHIRLAKAAGIEAFALSLYVWGNSPAERRLAEIFRKMLDVAAQEDFRLLWEGWWGGSNLPDFFVRYKDIVQHPNFYRVNGQPLIWVAPSVAPFDFWGTSIKEFDAITTTIEARLGTPVTWAINNGTGLDYTRSTKSVVLMTGSNLFSANDQAWADWVKADVREVHKRGKKIGTHVYPGFDETDLRPAEARYHPRRGGNTLRFALNTSSQAGADFIFVESWNDFGESTAVEPGYKEDLYDEPYRLDPYKDLKMIADFTGQSFTAPALPPESSIDPLVSDRLRNRVTFRGKAALAYGANNSNGVVFSLQTLYSGQWVSLASRLVRTQDGVVTMVQDISEMYGENRTLILAADANGGAGWDWAHWIEAVIEVNGVPVVDLIEEAPGAYWHSYKGTIPWGSGGSNGTAAYAYGVQMTDGRVYSKTLNVHPDFSYYGFSHGAYSADVLADGDHHWVTFRAKATLAKGADNSNGVVFALLTWDGQRWVTLARKLVRPSDGTVAMVQDLSQLYGQQRTLILAADANGDVGWDWAHWIEAVIEVDGVPAIDLIEQAAAAHWHSPQGTIAWGTSSPSGTAMHAYNVRTTDNRIFSKTLYVHPNLSYNGFSHGGYSNLLIGGE